MRLRLHAQDTRSRANGPGTRAVAWFQGCTLGCPGCFNPHTHDPGAGFETDTGALAEGWLSLRRSLEGVTISGGEPLEQGEALLDLLSRLRPSGLGVILFSGFHRREVEAIPQGRRILELADAAILGRYVASHHVGRGLLGSSNQEIVLLTGRYRLEELSRVPVAEVRIHRDGSMASTGIAPIGGPIAPPPRELSRAKSDQ